MFAFSFMASGMILSREPSTLIFSSFLMLLSVFFMLVVVVSSRIQAVERCPEASRREIQKALPMLREAVAASAAGAPSTRGELSASYYALSRANAQTAAARSGRAAVLMFANGRRGARFYGQPCVEAGLVDEAFNGEAPFAGKTRGTAQIPRLLRACCMWCWLHLTFWCPVTSLYVFVHLSYIFLQRKRL